MSACIIEHFLIEGWCRSSGNRNELCHFVILSLRYPNGSTYTGEWLGAHRHGNGVQAKAYGFPFMA